MTQGDQASVSKAHNFIFKRSFYTLSCTQRIIRGCRVMQGQQPLTLIKTRLSFCKPIIYKRLQVICIIFWPGGMLTFFPLIKVNQPENLFSPKVIFLNFGTTPQKHQIKLHLYRAKVQWGITKKEFKEFINSRVQSLTPRLLLIFPYTNYIN